MMTGINAWGKCNRPQSCRFPRGAGPGLSFRFLFLAPFPLLTHKNQTHSFDSASLTDHRSTSRFSASPSNREPIEPSRSHGGKKQPAARGAQQLLPHSPFPDLFGAPLSQTLNQLHPLRWEAPFPDRRTRASPVTRPEAQIAGSAHQPNQAADPAGSPGVGLGFSTSGGATRLAAASLQTIQL